MQVAANKGKLAKRLAPDAFPLDYSTAMRVIRDAAAALSPAPVVSCEGANTMDNARCGLRGLSSQTPQGVSMFCECGSAGHIADLAQSEGAVRCNSKMPPSAGCRMLPCSSTAHSNRGIR